jgi:TPR repeat protein
MTTWKYQLFVISEGAQAGADVAGHQGLEDELNDLGQQGWELTAVTDAGDAKIFILNSRTSLILWRWLKRCAGKIIACGIPHPRRGLWREHASNNVAECGGAKMTTWPEKLDPSTLQQLQAEAERGNAQAQYVLGGAYYNGNGVARNPAQGAQWLLKAAEGGYAPAQCDLGAMYEKGAGVDQSFDDAVKWYEKAARQGDALACHNMGTLRAKGFWDKKLGFFKRMKFARATSDNVRAYGSYRTHPADCNILSVAMWRGNTQCA